MIEALICKNRSCRRFYQEHAVSRQTLKDLVNLARLSASAANKQPLKYIISADRDRNHDIFDCLMWAAYLSDWDGPVDGERPSAYIIMLGDETISRDVGCDHGIAAQSILLGAREQGLAGCMLGAIDKPRLRQKLQIDDSLKIVLVIALGKPKEQVVIEALGPDKSIRYWRDKCQVHHVPKRSLEEIIIEEH